MRIVLRKVCSDDGLTDICISLHQADKIILDAPCSLHHDEYWYALTGSPAEGSRQILTAPGRGSGTGWLYVYHCWVSLLTSRYLPLKAFSTWSIVKEHTAELPEAPLYLERHKQASQQQWFTAYSVLILNTLKKLSVVLHWKPTSADIEYDHQLSVINSTI